MLFAGETSGEEEGVEIAGEGGGGCGEAEVELPQAGVGEGFAGAVGELAEIGEGFRIVGVDDAVTKVTDEEIVGEGAEGGGSDGESPGCVEVAAGGDGMGDEVAVGIEDVDEAVAGSDDGG